MGGNMKSVRTLVNLAVAGMTIAALTLGGRTAANAAPTHAPVTLTVASWSSTVQEENAVKKLLAAFTAKYHINTSYQVINGDYPTALKARITAGTAPDVFYLNSDVAQDFIQTGQIHNLDFLKTAPGYNFGDLYPSLVEGFLWKGSVYAIPKDQSTLALYYNKDMFKAAGISQPPTTEAQVTLDACKLTNKSKHIYGAVISADIARWWAFVYAAGGAVFNADQTKVVIDNPGAKQALSWYAGLVRMGCAALPSTVGATWNGDAFDKGLAAMVFEGNWLTQPTQQTAPNMHWGITFLPKGPKGYGNLAFTAAWAMSAKTKHFAEASKLIEFMTDANGERLWDKYSGYLPARKSVEYPAADRVFMEQVKYAKDFFFPPHGTTMETPMANDIQKVMENKMTVAAALADMQRQGNLALSVP
jgi:multiple sugar transport system substrate-binding protein